MNNKKILMISCAILITLLAGGAIAQPNGIGISPKKAKALDYRPVKLQDVVPCDKHPVFSQVPACQKLPGPPQKSPGPPQKPPGKGKGKSQNITQNLIEYNNDSSIYRVKNG